MTAIMPKDEVQKLLARYDLPVDCDCNDDDCLKCSHYPTFQMAAASALKDIAPDLARSLLAAHDEIDRLRADAGAAVALVVERAAGMIEDNFRHAKELGREVWAFPDLRTLADADGMAMVQALRAENKRLTDAVIDAGDDRDRLAADNARLAAQMEALTAYLHGLGTKLGPGRTSDSLAAESALRAALEAAILAAMTPAEQGEPR